MFVGSNSGLKQLVKTWQDFDWACLPFLLKKAQTFSSLYRVLRQRQFVVIKNKGHREKLLIILRHPVFSKLKYDQYFLFNLILKN